MAKTKFSKRKQKNKTRKTKKIKGGAPHKFSTKEELKNAIYQFCNIQKKAGAIRKYGRIQKWDVSAITDMSYLFSNKSKFDDDISGWNVSNVTNMAYIFFGCTSFNMPLDSWDVSNVTDMKGMFWNCVAFNQPLNSWNVSNVTDMYHMFSHCTVFNQSLSCWNVSKVSRITGIFNKTSLNNLDDEELAEKIFLIDWDLNVNANANDIPISVDALFELSRKNMFYNDFDRFNRIKELRNRIQSKIESKCISELGVKRNLPDTTKPYIFSFLHPEQTDKYGTSVAKAGPSVTRAMQTLKEKFVPKIKKRIHTRKHKGTNEGDLKIDNIENE